MWFLILQILLMLLLAALAGAMFAYWWVRRRYVDVTDSHEMLLDQVGKADGVSNFATREDIDAKFTSLTSSFEALPQPDFDPIQSRLSSLENAIDRIHLPETDFSPVQERMESIEAHLMSPNSDLDSLHARMTQLENAIGNVQERVSVLHNTDLDPVHQQIYRVEEKVEGIAVPETDLGPLHSGLAQLELSLADLDIPQVDLSDVYTRLSALERRIIDLGENDVTNLGKSIHDQLYGVRQAVDGIDLPQTDLAPVYERLDRLESYATAPNQDLQSIYAHLARFEGAIDAIDRDPVDLSPVHARLAQLDATLGSMRSEMNGLDALDRRIVALQESVMRIPQPDLTPVLTSVHTLDSRMDMSGLEGRLTAIEYGLAALHHTLRSRPEATTVSSAITDVSYRPEPVRSEYVEPLARPVPQPAPRPAPKPAPRDTRTRVRSVDPLGSARRPDDQANLLTNAAFGHADELEEISGVGPMLRDMLNDIGVYYFWQIAEWDDKDIDWVDAKLEHFKGRISRDDWVGQATELETLPTSATRPDGFDPN